jgi:predicted restriction endonuclease
LCRFSRWCQFAGRKLGDLDFVHTSTDQDADSSNAFFKTKALDREKTVAKRGRIRVFLKALQELREKVLKRDGWRCQTCGRSENLHVHHMVFRSQLGDDVEENLITLCSNCHQKVHGRASEQDDTGCTF